MCAMMLLPNSVHLDESLSGFPTLVIQHPMAYARVALSGGHVMEWQPYGHEPVLYLSPCSGMQTGVAIRGGIPICWPWFGGRPDNPLLPAHGFARTQLWQLNRAEETDSGVFLAMGLRENAQTLALWPHPFALELLVEIGQQLEVVLVVRNCGAERIAYSGALHTYLHTGPINAVQVHGLDGVEYLDTVGARVSRKQEGNVVFDREVDRIFRHRDGCCLVDGEKKRKINVAQEGGKDLVVWNPWIEKSLRLKDLPPDGYLGFVCLEAAHCDVPLIELEPGAQHRLGTRLTVE